MEQQFEMSKNLLYDVIMRQAGSIKKAIMEMIQNAVDAGATKIELVITKDRVVIIDNGCGMDEKNISEYFKKFGNSSKRGDKSKIGNFGMGRGQGFAMGKNVYLTLDNKMVVDIKENGLKYDLFKTDESIQGCKVIIDLYDEKKIDDWDLRNIKDILSKVFYFPQIDFTINGESVEYEEGEMIKIDNITATEIDGNYTNVFVMGMFVKRISNTVDNYRITCDDLQLNFARNDFIIDENYKKFILSIEKLNIKSIKSYDRRKQFHNDSLIFSLMERKKLTVDDVLKLKFIPSSDNNYYSLSFLKQNGNVINVSDQRDPIGASNIIKNNVKATVINCDSKYDSLFNNVNLVVRDSVPYVKGIESLNKLFKKVAVVVDPEVDEMNAKLNKFSVCIQNMNYELGNLYEDESRELIFTQNAKYEAQTDSETIWFNLDTLKGKTVYEGTHIIYSVLTHEYAHTGTIKENESHSLEFYELFHNYIMKSRDIFGYYIKEWSNKSRNILF